MIQVKIAYICSHWFGFPGLELVQSRGMLAGIAIPDVPGDSTDLLRRLAQGAGPPLLALKREELRDRLPAWLEDIGADALFTVSFPWRIPVAALTVPPLGGYNYHPGVLPDYRGIEPIFWTIRDGEPRTAVTAIRMDKGLDTGGIVLAEALPVHPDDTYGLLLNKLAIACRAAMEKLLERLENEGTPASAAQPRTDHPLRRRPSEKELRVSWKTMTAQEIRNLVRASNPAYGGAMVNLRGIPFRLLESSVLQPPQENLMPGTVVTAGGEEGLGVACRDGVLKIDIISGQDGVFTGDKFAALYGIARGDLFTC